jgi:myosin heavy subunit
MQDALLPGLESLVKASEDEFVSKLFAEEAPAAGADDGKKKKTAVRRRGKQKIKTLASSFKGQLDQLMSTINSCDPHFVRCMKPNAEKKGGIFTASMMMAQLSYAGVLEVCRIRQVGFPMRREFSAFLRRYAPIVPESVGDGKDGCKKLCEALQAKGILEAGGWALGKSKVFMRATAQNALDAARAASLEKFVVMMQSAARRRIVISRAKLWRSTLKGIRDASASKDLTELTRCVGLSENLPYRGTHLAAVKDARTLIAQLEEQKQFVSALRAAIDDGELSVMESLVESAASMPGFDAPELEEARKMIETLHKHTKLREALSAAVASKDKKQLDDALTAAEEAGMEGSNEYEVARSLLDTIEEHEAIQEELQDAIDNGNLKNLNALLTSVIDLGMDETAPVIVKAKAAQTQLKEQQESKYLLKKAVGVAKTTRESEDLATAIAKAEASGMEASLEELAEAKALLGEIQGEGAVRSKLEAALASQDTAALSAALEDVKAKGLKGAGGLINEAKAVLQRVQNEEKVLTQIKTAMGTRNLENLTKALAMADNMWPNTEGLPEVAAKLDEARGMLQKMGSNADALGAIKSAMDAAKQKCGVTELQMLSAAVEQGAAAGMTNDPAFAEAKDLESILRQRMAAEKELRDVLVTEGGTEVADLERRLEAGYGLGLTAANSDTVKQAETALALLNRRMSVAPAMHAKEGNQALAEAVETRDPDAISLAIMIVLRGGASVTDPQVSMAKALVAQLIQEREIEAQLQVGGRHTAQSTQHTAHSTQHAARSTQHATHHLLLSSFFFVLSLFSHSSLLVSKICSLNLSVSPPPLPCLPLPFSRCSPRTPRATARRSSASQASSRPHSRRRTRCTWRARLSTRRGRRAAGRRRRRAPWRS